MLPLFEANCFESSHGQRNNHSSIMRKQMLGVLLFVFTVYRAIDLCLDFYYCTYEVGHDDAFTTIFVLGAAFHLWYIFHAISICCSHRQADPNFHPVEGIVNLVQITIACLRANTDIGNGCIFSIDFYYIPCCWCGVAFQFFCFIRNIWSYYREEKVCYLVVNIMGVLLSIISACFGYLCMSAFYGEGLPDCRGYYL